MSDLFSEAAQERQAENAPLAVRLRPSRLEELVGQQHVLAPGSALRLAIEEDRPPSMILFGPPGTGKTTIARIVAERTGAVFEEISAVSARVDDVRAVIARARDYLLSPQVPYEQVGDVPNVVFPCAALVDLPADRLTVYYGGADTVVCMAHGHVSELLDFVRRDAPVASGRRQ